MGESTDEYTWLLDALDDRRVVAVDVRGRGRSDAPPSGYAWEDHIGDVAAVIDAAGLEQPVLVGFSRGSSYALGYALRAPERVRALVIGDYFARHVGLPPEFAERQLAVVLRGVPMSERMPEHAVLGVARESREVPLWDRLGELDGPVLLVRGGRRGVLANDEVTAQWQAALPTVQVAMLPNAGHDLWSRDPDAYLAVLRAFLESVDASRTS
jgi:pimeloyl-ACP methyl ester carboxylesterase